MNDLIKRIQIFSLFWAIIPLYFIIAFLISPIDCPDWISNIDKHIPFVGWMILPYYSYYLLIIIPPFIIKNKQKLKALTNILIKTTLFCYFIYCVWPISSGNILNQVESDTFSFLHASITFDFLHQNALPSMHVAVSGVIAFTLSEEYPNWGKLFYLIALGIFLGTFLIKQHYILDSISGLVIVIIVYYLKKN